jgi:hypothetical protein
MITRFILIGCLVAIQAAIAGDQRSELKLNRPVEGKDVFVISAAPHKRVVIFVKDGAVSTLDVSADFPYSVMLTESPTPRYKAVLVFEDRRKDIVADSFGVTVASSVEQTDDETHKALVDSAAEARAMGEKLGKDIRAGHR